MIDLASNITLYANPVPDVRFHCGVTDLMGQEIGEYDFEYEAQIAYIDDRIKKITDLKEIISLQDERAQLQVMQMQSQRGLIIELQEKRKYDPIDTLSQISHLLMILMSQQEKINQQEKMGTI